MSAPKPTPLPIWARRSAAAGKAKTADEVLASISQKLVPPPAEPTRMSSNNLPGKWKSPVDSKGNASSEWRKRVFQETGVRKLKKLQNEIEKSKAARASSKFTDLGGVVETDQLIDNTESNLNSTTEKSLDIINDESKGDVLVSSLSKESESSKKRTESPSTLITEHEFFLHLSQSDFPLSRYDNQVFEYFADNNTEDNWIKICDTGKSPVLSIGDDNEHVWKWTACKIVEFDQKSERFRIQIGKTEKLVRRLDLMFDVEDEDVFMKRLAYCKEKQQSEMSKLRQKYFIDQQPKGTVAPIQNKWVENILWCSGYDPDAPNSGRGKTRRLVRDIMDTYRFGSVMSVVFLRARKDEEYAQFLRDLRHPEIPPLPSIKQIGGIEMTSSYSHKKYTIVTKRVKRNCTLMNKNILPIAKYAQKVWSSGRKASRLVIDLKSLHNKTCGEILQGQNNEDSANYGLALPCSIFDLEKAHKKNIKESKQKLQQDWWRVVSDSITDKLQKHYNFYSSNLEVYQNSPLFKVITLFKLLMAQQLRNLVSDTVNEWTSGLSSFIPDAKKTAALRKKEADATAKAAAEALDVVKAAQKTIDDLLEDDEISEDGEEVENAQLLLLLAKNEHARLQVDAEYFSSMQNDPALNDPLLDITFKTQNNTILLEPSPLKIEKILVGVLEDAAETVRSFVTLENKLLVVLETEESPILDIGHESNECGGIDQELKAGCEQVRKYLDESLKGPRALASLFEPLAKLCNIIPEKYLDDLDATSPSVEELKNEIRTFMGAAKRIQEICYEYEYFGMFRVNTRSLKDELLEKALGVGKGLMTRIITKAKASNDEVVQSYKSLIERLGIKPTNEVELKDLNTFIAGLGDTMNELGARVDANHANLAILDEFHCPMEQDDFNLAWSVFEWPQEVVDAKGLALFKLEADSNKMQRALDKEKEIFSESIDRMQVEVQGFKLYGDWDNMKIVVEKANNLQGMLETAEKKAESLNNREVLFGWEPQDFSLITHLITEFEPYYNLWAMCDDYRSKSEMWVTGPFLSLDAESMEDDVTKWWTKSYTTAKKMERVAPDASKVASRLRKEVDDFKENLPLVQSLASKALRERHWNSLADIIQTETFRLVPDEELTLQQLLDINVMDYWDDIEVVSVKAEKEYRLENALNGMLKEWDDYVFDVREYRNTGTFVLSPSEEVVMLLDDQLVKTQAMLGSPYIKPFIVKARKWEKRLQYIQELLDEWLGCQRTWMYLEPIFGSDDIMRQMPTEGRKFRTIDSMWRKTMADVKENNGVMQVGTKDKLLGRFREANKVLDIIQKGLSDYLEVKRLVFPRFYFLSNDELLEILSQTKDPLAVQAHLGKCFEGINKAGFRGEKADLELYKMISAEKEEVPLLEGSTIWPVRGKNRGNVENWLTELQNSMRLSVKDIVVKSMISYPQTKRTEWMTSWPGMVILTISAFYWTKEVEEAINCGKLDDYHEVLNKQLMDLVLRVRGKLDKRKRTSLGALCVIDVHQRDVVTAMCEEKVNNTNNFTWNSQLRYYYEDSPDDYNRFGEDPMNFVPRIINVAVTYGYEYLGNSWRLVITPLTDRCYRTMMGAVGLMYGGAPAGPAGTGKTETVKDLSKAVAIQCVVFNCSDGLDFKAMGKFFKGLAASGAWACFDEFNRIELEVLSVIAQQLLEILRAKRGRVKDFDFEGSHIPLNPDCNSFITMNPGYAGRAELPENLKALYRPCAMMVPDYAMIAEIKLYSYGFEQGKPLSRKLTQVLTICSEQLSAQKHYDYGMRAVFSILVRAGNLRQERGDLKKEDGTPLWTEEMLVYSGIVDVNLPKFTLPDLPLFKGILSDLFPSCTLPSADYGPLIPTIKEQCKKHKLQLQTDFVTAIVQLYETVQVRHGLMVVGECMSGKSNIIHRLAEAMTIVNETLGDVDTDSFWNTIIRTINPKALTMGQLYGQFDPNTHEWTDGVLAVVYRICAKDPVNANWLLFDGPVDTIWIESMNTVLDDNKKLCLVSGEIIKMSPTQTIMFETQDLEVASPATVSRVGMVFVEQNRLGWRPMLDSWIEYSFAEEDGELKEFYEQRETVKSWVDWLWLPLADFAMRNVKVPLMVTRNEHIKTFINLYDSLIKNMLRDHIRCAKPSLKPNDYLKALEGLLLKALIWSTMATTNNTGRIKIADYFCRLITGELGDNPTYTLFRQKNPEWQNINAEEGDTHLQRKIKYVKAPFALEQIELKGSNVRALPYEYKFILPNCTWVSWMKGLPLYKPTPDMSFAQIIVPTMDTVRNMWVFDTYVHNNQSVLVCGDTGTGKSVSLGKQLLTEYARQSEETPTLCNNRKYVPVFINFSAQTSANQTQDIIDSKLSKRRKGVFGPPFGKTCIIFVDDLNMPVKEIYGAQPPIEILRQWMTQGGWYNRKECEYCELIDLQFVAAMGPPGGGRTDITERYRRHYNILSIVPFDSDSLQKVFSIIVDWALSKHSGSVKALNKSLVSSVIDMYQSIIDNLKPTPAKLHYTFNLRDVSKVFQGISMCHPKTVDGPTDMIRLWAHECSRVLHDRLINVQDRKWFFDAIAEKCKKHFKMDWKSVKGKNETLFYGNYSDPTATSPQYQEVKDQEKLFDTMYEYLGDYNNMNKTKMNLVLFENAIEHVSRINRVLNQPRGNVLLVGVGGSGRKSLTRLSAFIQGTTTFMIEISKTYGLTEWRDDLKSVFRTAGLDRKPIAFLFSDTQVKDEIFIEDINNILNTGEVPNIFEKDEMTEIIEGCQKFAAEAEGYNADIASEVFKYFVDQCKTNMHVVLAFSPVGDSFRERLLMFPSLVNCCTIDWFTAWPESALRSVATEFIKDIELDDITRTGVVETAVDMQKRASDISVRYLKEVGRYYYVTPTSYLELINTFRSLVGDKRTAVEQAKQRYDNGLQKISETAAQVGGMQEELRALQPKLEEATIETDAMIVKITKMAADAAIVEKKVAADKAVCDGQAADAKAIKDECEAELAVAIPALNAAIKALDTLNKNDLTEVKSMSKPPSGVVLTMKAVCIMFGVKADKIKNPNGFGKIDDYWSPAKKVVLGKNNLIKEMKEYDKDNISPKIMKKVRPMADDPEFAPKVIERQSKAAAGMCQWVHALITYDHVAKIVEPKKIKLAESEVTLAAALEDLSVKVAELKVVQDRVAKLQAELDEKKKAKEQLEFDVQQCKDRLERAQSLISGLGGEQERWTEKSKLLGERLVNVVGDIVIASGTVAYLGPFSMVYRKDCIEAWSSVLRTQKVPCSEVFNMQIVLGSDIQTREWTINKLPNDSFSIDNAIILDKSARWPLMIDPQMQANKWVRNMESETEPPLKICKQNEATFVRTIENAISFGSPVLLENVPVELDPVLESILARQVVKSGGVETIRVGDTYVEYDQRFKLYITTKLPNPHFPPEICVQVNLLNFVATQKGLEDQMLGIVVSAERPDLATQLQQLVVEDAANQKKLTELEDKILHLLASAEGNILDDSVLIKALGDSKITSDQIMAQVKVAARTKARIEETRKEYQPVAYASSNIFFCIADLCNVDPMYQYSLEFFINLFLVAIERALTSKKVSKRVSYLNDSMLRVLYQNVCRSLFEKDKLMFSFMLTSTILIMSKKITMSHLRFFVQGSTSLKLAKPNPCKGRGTSKWLSDRNWGDILALSEQTGYESFAEFMSSELSKWAPVMTGNDNPIDLITELVKSSFPEVWDVGMILRCLRPDYVTECVQKIVIEHMGREFVEPPAFDLAACYEDATNVIPLIFVLAPGADPVTDLLNFAAKEGYGDKLICVSLGQGQGPIAEKAVDEAVDKGSWVCLQNCHLCKSWMPSLEKIVENLDPTRIHDSFRMWLTSMPAKHFPVSVLQNGVKMTKEAPKGIRASLIGTYTNMNPDTFEGCRHEKAFKKMLFGLSFFHALVRERCSYGPLGWNIPYAFSEPDLRISIDQLRNILDVSDFIPYSALNYLVSECNYGGRVTDDKDRRCIKTILTDFYTPDIQDSEYKFSISGIYYSPKNGSLDSYMTYIKSLPLVEGPEIFGMHNNASITSATQETNYLFSTILSLQPKASGEEGMTWEDSLSILANKIERRIPELYDIEKVIIDYPITYSESMNTVLVQELERFNVLVKRIKDSLRDIQRAITGEVVMSKALLQMGSEMSDGLVPEMWSSVAYPSLCPLGSWVTDLLKRLKFFDEWIDGGVPAIFWISGFFFTQAFLTGTRQNFARKYTIPIDLVEWDFSVLSPAESNKVNERAPDGAYVQGMFLDGAGWDVENMVLCESAPKVLYTPMMTVLILPLHMDDKDRTKHSYKTPLYKTSERRGMLSTTGHSTNFVLMFELPMGKEHSEKHWVKRGVAMLTQLDD